MWPSTEAAVYAAAAVVQGASGVLAGQAAAHRQLALQALRDWDPTGSRDYWAVYREALQAAALEGALPAVGSDGVSLASAYLAALEGKLEAGLPGAGTEVGPVVLFKSFVNWVTPIRSDMTLGHGVAVALELKRVIRQLVNQAPPECPCFSDVVPFVMDRIAETSARETVAALNLEMSDALPVSAPAARLLYMRQSHPSLLSSAYLFSFTCTSPQSSLIMCPSCLNESDVAHFPSQQQFNLHPQTCGHIKRSFYCLPIADGRAIPAPSSTDKLRAAHRLFCHAVSPLCRGYPSQPDSRLTDARACR